ncbi:NAD(P)H-binding protein [Streptococcus uberis]|uniref:NAD(P)H-binding protein n=1 Tax=Streptococcus uberis TaxID=1349 RepID=UPI00378C48A0|nr:NAD(P)H-binding protein [Streptococcus uberis]
MKNVLVIGATGSLGQTLRKEVANNCDYQLTLFSRTSEKLTLFSNEKAISGSVFDSKRLNEAISDQDIVFVALSGDLPKMIREVVKAMKEQSVKRMIFVSSIGIYDEIMGSGNLSNNPILEPYRKAADIVEASELDYTILRPAWFDNQSDNVCQLSHKGEPVTGNTVSRKAIISKVREMIDNPNQYQNDNIALYR